MRNSRRLTRLIAGCALVCAAIPLRADEGQVVFFTDSAVSLPAAATSVPWSNTGLTSPFEETRATPVGYEFDWQRAASASPDPLMASTPGFPYGTGSVPDMDHSSSPPQLAEVARYSPWLRNWDAICDDYSKFYTTWHNFSRVWLGIGVGAVLANTSADQHVRDWYQAHERNSGTDHVADVFEGFGRGEYVIPLYIAITLGEIWYESNYQEPTLIGIWGENCFRSILVGAPTMVFFQFATGGPRPNDGEGSEWHPFQEAHGVSGHAFMGAVPFLNAAHMTDNWLLKTTFVGLSTITAWSRVNDDKHYLSQVLMGWWLAYLATDAVHQSNLNSSRFTITPVMLNDGVGVSLEYNW